MIYPIADTAGILRTTRDIETSQRLYARVAPKTEATVEPTDYAQAFVRADQTAAAPGVPTYLEDLNAYRTQELNSIYDSSGATSRVTSNTILIGYG